MPDGRWRTQAVQRLAYGSFANPRLDFSDGGLPGCTRNLGGVRRSNSMSEIKKGHPLLAAEGPFVLTRSRKDGVVGL